MPQGRRKALAPWARHEAPLRGEMPSARAAVHPGELAIALGLIALGSFIIYETQGIAEAQGYAQVGPRLFPYLIGVGLAVCGAVLGWQAISGGWRHVPLDEGRSRPGLDGVLRHQRRHRSAHADHRLGRFHPRIDPAVRAGRARIRQQATGAGRGHRRRPGRHRVRHLHAGTRTQPAQGSVRGGVLMETFSALLAGFAVALTPINLMWGFVGVTLGTAIGVLPGVGPALTIALLLPVDGEGRSDRRADHVRRHLLRRDVRRLDDVDPAQHAGRVGDHRHGDGRQPDGEARARGTRACDRRDRLVRRRNDRDDPAHRDGADRRRLRTEVRACRNTSR